MKPEEKNLTFIAFLLLFLLFLGGVALVDTNLTRLIMPETPFATISLAYEHGLVFKGPETCYCLPSLDILTLSSGKDNLRLSRGGPGLKVPRFISLGNIDKLRRLLDIDKLMP